ncbi:hypothetical protein K488DRAFT_77953 [Vararia minispora EC-137]|uniref:Uncharacterized protein n=1 Tax=Vararia minispora EC-137 TaxID=1314806 RepID=A0ACB8QNT5_9AGAM|nr:hypothetical protein K488DRAFT_77953 [Vararia minispora EC-137]
MQSPPGQTTAIANHLPRDILLIIFVHGFKGTDETFHSFPSRLKHVLTESIEDVSVESIVFPAYETKGELDKAVERFADWLATLTVQKEVAHGTGGGAGKAKIVLCGHSMGGLLIADTLLAIVSNRTHQEAPLWPNIIACLAFDTPYLGLHPHIFKNSATKALGYAQTAHKAATDAWDAFGAFNKAKSSSGATQTAGLLSAPPTDVPTQNSGSAWARWAAPAAYAVGGALLAGGIAGTAFYKRNDILSGYTYLQDHMRYVGNLWDETSLQRRMDGLLRAEQEHGVAFRTYYTLLPPDIRNHISERTFVVLPTSRDAAAHFEGARNTLAEDEVQAHIGMFEPSTNDGYYQLGLTVASVVREALMRCRGIKESKDENNAEVVKHSEELTKTVAREGSEPPTNPWAKVENDTEPSMNPWAD